MTADNIYGEEVKSEESIQKLRENITKGITPKFTLTRYVKGRHRLTVAQSDGVVEYTNHFSAEK